MAKGWKKRKKPIDWPAIKEAYQRDEGSCRELAIRFKIPESTLEARCWREKWRIEKKEIVEKVKQNVIEHIEHKTEKWVNTIFHRATQRLKNIDDTLNQLLPAADPDGLLALIRGEKIVDDMARRALGLPDSPAAIDVKSNGKSIQESIIESFLVIKKMHEEGKFKGITIDAEELATAEIIDD